MGKLSYLEKSIAIALKKPEPLYSAPVTQPVKTFYKHSKF